MRGVMRVLFALFILRICHNPPRRISKPGIWGESFGRVCSKLITLAATIERDHACAVTLQSMYYNFARLHQTLKVSPAKAAGVTDRLWEMVDVIDVLNAFEAKRKRASKPIFEVERWAIGGGYYVRATLIDGTVAGSTALPRKARLAAGLETSPMYG
jgi:hypothetical protein